MDLFSGIAYNYKGLKLGVKTPSLLFLGLVRFVVVVAITIASAGLVLSYYHEILGLIWGRPESSWVVWLWHLVSWLVALLLVGLSSVVSFLVSQLLFSVIIMDAMSRITEQRVTGQEKEAQRMPWLKHFFLPAQTGDPQGSNSGADCPDTHGSWLAHATGTCHNDHFITCGGNFFVLGQHRPDSGQKDRAFRQPV